MPARLTLILLTATLLCAATAGSAQAASRIIVRGAGFGHGVGMSQWGAYGFARQGSDHAAILAHYYSGTQIARLSNDTDVRVLLRNGGRIAFRGATAVAGDRRLDPPQTYYASASLGAIVLRSARGRDLGTYKAPLRLSGGRAGIRVLGRAANGIADGRYRGDLEVRPAAIGVAAINVVRMEDYVRGVVAGEVPASWPVEVLRAQAVAARTYAIATRKDGDGYDQYADTRSQMYPGIAGEHPSTDAAVAATKGEVVAYDGKPIVTYYFSTSGGRTENVENSFLGAEPAPWLQSVDDPFDHASPRHRWTRRMTLASAGRRLGGLVKGSLRQIRVLTRGRSPRVVRAQIVGTGGRRNVSGPQLRSRLGLYDTWARFTVITATGARGDGNKPRASAPKGTTGGGGAAPSGGATPARREARTRSPGGSHPLAGGLAPARRGARTRSPGTGRAQAGHRQGTGRAQAAGSAGAASLRLARGEPLTVAGVVAGRVAPAIAGRQVLVEHYEAGRWIELAQTLTRAGGRYRAEVPEPGLYRVRYAGELGPPVRV